jgi:glucose 1-dehydrogenase
LFEETMRLLEGQTVLVTGAGSGIGAEVARAMAAAGANVGVNYPSDESQADQVVSDITKTGGTAIALQADVSREDQVIAMFKNLIAEYGTIDILVSNAGIQRDSVFADMTLEQWDAVIGVNLTGGFLCAREAVREFLRRGVVPERSKAAGKIIFTSSVHEIIPWAGHANYASSKGGMMLLMKTLAQELAPKKIRVNSIGPGAIKTAINERVWRDPADIAPVAVWLASDEADYITGTTIFVDGGMLLYPGFRTGG